MKLDLLTLPFRVLVRPFDGFWDMKYEEKGRLTIAYIILFFLVIVQILRSQYVGFLYNFNNPQYLNSINEFKYIVLPFFLWCISNWSLTVLMDGEGKFKEILTATGYAVLPLIVVYVPTMIMSHFITMEEGAFYYFFNSAAVVWAAWLLFVGMMTIHQYTPLMTVVTMGLTVIVMGIIIFLGLLTFSLIQQIQFFFETIYREIVFWS
ncbi:Yip1 family protein [Paenibacillus solisilvae]|uniref:Yip1 family protein n=1 Tax=Paenibacillus solisilvae TaxID=2486751 RepID=A0ABW0W693_9BACL